MGTLLLLALVAASGVSAAPEGDSEIGSFLETYTATWNTHDGNALAALFTPDADIIMGNLPPVIGREAIGGWWNAYFSQIDEGRKGEFDVLSLRDVAPDVQLVNVASKTSGADEHGTELETRLARGTWILVKKDGTWRIAAMRGLPAEGERRVRPGTDR